jgi:DNA-binding MarR family transcriptional regulator
MEIMSMKKTIHIGRDVNIFVNRVNRRVSNIVAQYGITGSQAHIINFIYDESQRNNVFQKDIEKEFDIRRSSATNALQLMEKRGLIIRERVSIDARLKKVSLTEKGISIQKNVNNIIIASEKALRETLTEDEYKTLISVINKLSNINF